LAVANYCSLPPIKVCSACKNHFDEKKKEANFTLHFCFYHRFMKPFISVQASFFAASLFELPVNSMKPFLFVKLD
jgi:hypothetical protein